MEKIIPIGALDENASNGTNFITMKYVSTSKTRSKAIPENAFMNRGKNCFRPELSEDPSIINLSFVNADIEKYIHLFSIINRLV